MIPIMDAIRDLPLVAILRGLKPAEAGDIGEALVNAGFRCLEVPLNSPDPLDSIAILSDRLKGRAIIGAGTVLSVYQAQDVAKAGGRLMVSPNCDADVIRAAKDAGMYALPGVLTPTEAFAAINAGADGLKLFPAEMAPPQVLKAMRAVLPADMPVFAVGGITPETMGPYYAAGAAGFGLGSAIYKPGDSAETVSAKAQAFTAAWAALQKNIG